ncbi:hypothetical protein JYK14_17145 [Siccirubricoccus sp. KC 17139]|uniref:Calcium-binding protein n=1 Tax=Siccirubricoccus soli TaxID=2899147 RepID=A0ABT1D7I1_9PROT|nr:calcium-binding protein [Siccirubricoccus soli]MCO6417877.1 hypothetical protein [Siccirubricoccus soli]MCP2684012.1 hypothetical protein [Siccirubricoccus soli]
MPTLSWSYAEYQASSGPPAGATVIIADSPAVLEALSPSDLAALAAAGIHGIDSTADALALGVAQLQALGPLALSAGDRVLLADAGSTLSALAAEDILALVTVRGLAGVAATSGALAWNAAQVAALQGRPLVLDFTDWLAGSTAYDAVDPSFRLEVEAVPAAYAASLFAAPEVDAVRIADGSAAISADFHTLAQGSAKLQSITLTDGEPLALSYDNYLNDGAALAVIRGAYGLSLAGAPATAAATLQADARVTGFSVSDSAAAVAAALDALAGAGKLTGIALLDSAPLEITAAQFAADAAVLARLPSGHTLSIAAASVAGAAALEADDHVIGFTVRDSAANIAAGLASLGSYAKLSAIALSDGPALALDYATWSGAQAVLGKIEGADIAVHGVAVADAFAVQDSPYDASFTLSDSTANVVAALESLAAMPHLAGIGLTDSVPILLEAGRYPAIAALLPLLPPGRGITVAEAPADLAAALQADASITGFTVSDTAEAIASALEQLAASGKLAGITLTDGAALVLTEAQYLAGGAALALLPGGTSLQVTGAATVRLAALAADARVAGFTVLDSAAHIAADFAALQGAAKLTGLAVQGGGPLGLTAAQYASPGNLLSLLPEDYTLTVSGLAAAAAEAAQAEAHVTAFTVLDSAANLAAALDQIAGYGKISAIALSDGSSLAIAFGQLASAAAALARLDPGITLTVADAVMAEAAAAQADARVGGFTLADTAANLSAGFGQLAGAGKLTAITVTDAAPVTLDYATYAAAPAALALLAGSPTLVVTEATAAQAAALQADAAVDGFSVSDSAANIAVALDSLAAAGKLTAVHVLDSFVLPITYAQYLADGAALALLQDGARIAVSGATAGAVAAAEGDDAVLAIAVQDSAANIAAAFDSLNAATKLTAIELVGGADLVLGRTQIIEGSRALGLVGSSAPLAVQADAAVLGFTPAELTELADHGVQKLAAAGGSLALDVAQYLGLGPIHLMAADNVTLADLGAHYAALGAAEIAGLAAAGVDRLDATDNRLGLTLEQLGALGSVAIAGGDLLTLADSGATIGALTATEIAALASRGIAAIDATDDALSLSYAQYHALASIALDTEDDVTLADTAASLANRNTQAMAGIDRLLVYESPGGQRINGTLGDDIYYVDSVGDIITEGANGGRDTLIASIGFYLGASIENLTLGIGAGAIFGMGNELANSLTGNEDANLMAGFSGGDTVHGDDGNDTLHGLDGDDSLDGGASADYLTSGAGNDTLFGGTGSDTLHGEAGNDHLTGGPDLAFDLLTGGAGNDTLDGASGLHEADMLLGGAGNDLHYVDTAADQVVELPGEGEDTIVAAIDGPGYYLPENVEDLVLLTAIPFALGNGLSNRITGSASADWLLGGGGDDTLNGMAGDDTLLGETGSDVFVFSPGTGHDLILDFHQGQDRIRLSGFDLGPHPTMLAYIQARSGVIDGNLLIDLGQGDSVLLHHVTGLTTYDLG